MDKIKDIIYEYSDAALGFIIVFVMVAVIGWQLYNWFEPSETLKLASNKPSPVSANATAKNNDTASDDSALGNKSSENTSENADNTDKAIDTGKSQDNPSSMQENKKTPEKVVFQIKQGSSCEQIAIALEQTGLVDSKDSFLKQIISKQLENKLKSGTYTIEKDQSVESIIAILTK